MRVGEAGKDAAAAEVDDVRARQAPVSCVPTPPATSRPAIASARVVGSVGSIVRMTPFSRIMRGDCSDEKEWNDRPRAGLNVTDLEKQRRRSTEGARTARLLGPLRARMAMVVLRRRATALDFWRRRDAILRAGHARRRSQAPRSRDASTRSTTRRWPRAATDNGAPGLRPRVRRGLLRRVRPRSRRQQHRGRLPRGRNQRPRLRSCPGSR